ncbi:MAG TPA: sugar phosphate nucleotidyltransferase [Candidatus Binatia bacterium]|jgi:mannose-1-phosphate guanylyltransferase
MKPEFFAVVMAGGKGSRFWPLSRPSRPKQMLRLLTAKSLVRETVNRLTPVFGRRNILIVAVDEQQRAMRRELRMLPKRNFLIEPLGKNTAPCIGLAAIELLERDPEAIAAILPADHWISDTRRFSRALEKAIAVAAETDALVTLGIRPAHPETGYGYIVKAKGRAQARRVRGFVEKPPAAHARKLIASGALWNSGIFVARVATFLAAFRRYAPQIARRLDAIAAIAHGRSLGGLSSAARAALKREYRKMPNVSIDYAVMEKAGSDGKVMTIEADFGWSDVGNWEALHRMLPKKRSGNAGVGPHFPFRSSNCLVYSADGRLVALVGMENTVVVDTPDAILVADIRRAQEIKDLTDELSLRGFRKYVAK